MMDTFYKNSQNALFRNPILSNYDEVLEELTKAEFEAQLAINNAPLAATAEQTRAADMLAGVEFEGVMCSATKEDMWGLSSVRDYILSGATIPFKFENQNTIILDSSNLPAFEAVWVPFRASFFTI